MPLSTSICMDLKHGHGGVEASGRPPRCRCSVGPDAPSGHLDVTPLLLAKIR
jgi:hypothetical protein